MDVLIETDKSHKVNRQVVMQMCKEVHKKVDTGMGFKYIPLINNYSINVQQLNAAQNRSKNKYVNKLRKFILGCDDFGDEDYYSFTFGNELYYLEKKNRKSKLKLTPRLDISTIEKPTVDMAERIMQLESENEIRRQRGQHEPQKTNDIKNEGLLSELPAAQAQYTAIQPAYEPIQENPGFIPLADSPALKWMRDMCRRDKANYNPDAEKAWFKDIFNN